jgi:hypothetical protein
MKIKVVMKWTVLILLLILSIHTVSAISVSSIPQSGVWVRVNYPGNFTGSIRSDGKMIPVTGSVDQFYQVPTVDGIVTAILQKEDDSTNKIALEVYKNGVLLQRETNEIPNGIVGIQLDLKSLQTLTTVTTTVTTTSQSIIPQTGIWVRVMYPGKFTGSIGSTGKMIPVTGSVDQFYQVPIIDETVIAVFQKEDNSTNKITLDVYKNGVFLQRKTNTIPKGFVETWLDLKSLQTLTTVTSTSQPIIPQTKSVDERQQLGDQNNILTQITNFFKKMFGLK